MSSSRAPRPAPLNLHSSQGKQSFESSFSDRGRSRSTDGGDNNTPVATPSTAGMGSPHEAGRKTSSGNVNVYTTCGRHTDQFLFGGPSLGEMARSLLRHNR
ncbi:hypothetical protein jhhlp_006925 [Lomentospora prolificans]|uniref:Uncharacterized protein n=1 Tax=Lomentospora prolificans TaxID=41688 RepID=A0A2N3N344_9PEZI|nr:hypothetical protein jhhlp_006925 [Lomentospora prolificans]